ncbi:MAG: hypothetical protein EBZ54_02145 [Actinobacteria bacterium]|nr:hypothetical protein [Actinomycetota bacterium]
MIQPVQVAQAALEPGALVVTIHDLPDHAAMMTVQVVRAVSIQIVRRVRDVMMTDQQLAVVSVIVQNAQVVRVVMMTALRVVVVRLLVVLQVVAVSLIAMTVRRVRVEMMIARVSVGMMRVRRAHVEMMIVRLVHLARGLQHSRKPMKFVTVAAVGA